MTNIFGEVLLETAGHGDGHVLAVTAGVFGAGKTRSLAILLIVLTCELEDFSAVVFTKENVAAKALSDQICDLCPPTQSCFGRLLGRIEEGKARLMRHGWTFAVVTEIASLHKNGCSLLLVDLLQLN